jgi:uncharacterized RDD family membrane protein YckC
MDDDKVEYAGFWLRVWATVIDTVLLLVVLAPLLTALYGRSYWSAARFERSALEVVLSSLVPALAVVVFWMTKQATPGKLAISARIVDARTGRKPTAWQWILRYVGYFVAMAPCGLGLVWVAFDRRKQGWHDKLAGTVVVRMRPRSTAPAGAASR